MPEPDDLEHAVDDAFGPGAEERAERTARRMRRLAAAISEGIGSRPVIDPETGRWTWTTRVTDVFDDEV